MKKIIVCVKSRASQHQPSCAARGSEAIADQLEQLIINSKLAIQIERFKCLGCCEQGPNMRLAPFGKFYHQMTQDDLPSLMLELAALSK
ncbi:hypothetical protein A7981_08680 [Methylovorus sp. MM2]|uniref:(2Fe-2S) ferredoxin domain-containing protein n=1 Tax=Methylovorus sp. MM2 TaxID=1848038 RepID=UPI0007E2174A|nr:(2Fe-2S) ferredoxin domain-containing protein [Methylovorus sp. MM2]OAM51892.1 hypothetical protein A7981_08680 [Methylovorus sp. MM2]